ncbi:MAG: T4 family baseplate hub assembly chaperone [Solirubrobacteraceae bacterium]
MVPTAATLLQAWECGAAAAPLDRAPSLLQTLDVLPGGATADELTVGQCDARLFGLRREMFGQRAEIVATCPSCDTEVELNVDLDDLQPPVLAGPAEPLALEVDGYEVSCRAPSNADLRVLAADRGDPAPGDLLELCIDSVRAVDGEPVAAGELPEATEEAIIEAIAERDPGARTELVVRCPCGHEWSDEFDIRVVLWNDLTEWVGRTLTEVHQLAQSYGWSESEILAMGAWRRRWYLEASGW